MSLAGGSAQAQRRARDALARVPQWRGRRPRIVRPLGGGPTNEAWQVTCDDRDYMLRLDTALTHTLQLDRSAEAAIVAAAASAGIAPPTEYASPEHDLLVTRFVRGRTWDATDLRERANLQRLAARLRQLHALRPDVRRVDLSHTVQAYARRLDARSATRAGTATSSRHAARAVAAADTRPYGLDGDGCIDAGANENGNANATVDGVFSPPSAAETAGWATAICRLLDTMDPRPSVLCHNDLVAANIIDNGKTLWLIDWEYAGLGDAFFDLAVIVRHHDLDPTHTLQLLDAYLGSARDRDLARLREYCRIYDRVVLLWLAVLAQSGPLSDDQRALWAQTTTRVRSRA